VTTIEQRPPTAAAAPPERDYTTAELLLEGDKRRPRSKQQELGMSEVGGCRRRAGYRLAGVAPTNPGGSVQAVMGTAVHDAVERVFREMQKAGLLPAGDLVEHEVRFAGVLGHLDRYDSIRQRVKDTKTTSQRWLDHIILYGADLNHTWQGHLYGAALNQAGHPVREIVIDYLARDTGKDHQVVIPFDLKHVRDALAWLKTVRETPLEYLARDYEPESSFCGHCPFFTRCWDGGTPNRDPRSVLLVDQADAAKWAEQLWDARQTIKAAKKLEAEAKGALDGLRPNTFDTAEVDVGWERNLKWTVTVSRPLDGDQVRKEYAATGSRPPVKETTKVELRFAAKPKDGAK
jgi:hypothetical protein